MRLIRRLRFFRSLQWRLVTIFILIAFVLMSTAAVSLNLFVESFYYNTFKQGLEGGFERGFLNPGEDATEEDAERIVRHYSSNKANAMLDFYLNDHKTFTILDGRTNEVKFSDERSFSQDWESLSLEIQKSKNYLKALAGEIGDSESLFIVGNKEYFDYARPIENTPLIFYFRYDREEWAGLMDEFNKIIQLSFLIAIILSLLFGYVLSKTITVPIVNLMHRARKIASGDFGRVLEVKSDDEIGKLTKAFNYMASELKKNLNEVSREKNKIETILNYMTDGIIAFNLKGEVIHINPVLKVMLGIKEEWDMNFNEFSKRYDLGVSIEEISYLETYKTKEVNTTIGDKYVKVYFAIFTDENKKPDGVIAVFHDVTEQQKLDEMRREFVANVSHELRTPLTSIKSYSETLLEGALEDKETATKFLSVINSEADRMTRLVKDLLQLSRLDNNQMKWNITKFSLEKLVRDCIQKLEISANEKDQTIECYKIGDVEDVEADRDRIEQVLINILSNAMKYTPKGGKISIYVGKMYSSVYVKVKDSGIGIPKEDLPRIFERFYRTDKARSREMGGTGLGLAIAKEIIEAHNGEISVTSDIGKGTEFTIKLPVKCGL
ncbi:two-component system histidine kinase PnpS [Acetivibrio saccincola]|uniref:histidine kinase n=2 Tax=Acetivibrio saccincola TaxID=1677857 RepID=A0A2S8R7T4_9FIRM|nr:ATP-binding protein [Acetivibrio saccincola]PQQ65852.1 PAS domain-containing sensor histidine kinase [Acetivibrio saccincola]HQD29634.1 ATP-binding protein [Acetivibrio saccincola]